jgi:hypothetical protein
MKTQTFSKKTFSALIIIALFSYQSMFAEQIEIAEDIAPTHSIIFILSTLFFIAGFILLIMLKLREDEKEKEEDTISHPVKHRHYHPKHYGHKHQYNH